LSAAELAALGLLLQRTEAVYHQILHTERVHFGLYAEDIRHIPWHIVPRLTTLPAGNIPLTTRLRLDQCNAPCKCGVLQVGGGRNVPGTLQKVPGHAVICCSVPGTFSAPSVQYTLQMWSVCVLSVLREDYG
jgi:hypothetical protein